MDSTSSSPKLKLNMKCKYHLDHKVSFVNVSDVNSASRRILLCNECLSSNGQLAGKLVTIKSVVNASDKQVVSNWPFFSDENVQKIFNQRKHNIYHKMVQQFDKFKTSIIKYVDILQKKVLTSLEQNECDKIIEEFINQSQLQDLSEILMSNKSYEDTEAALKQFIMKCSPKFQNFEQDLFNKKKVLQDYTFLTQTIGKEQEEILKKIKNQICQVQQNETAQIECLLKKLQFQASTFQNCQSFANIDECEDICITAMKNKVGYPQIVSDFVFDKQQKYMIRVEIQTNNNYYYPMIGLIRKQLQDTNKIYQENLCFYVNSKGVKKVLKGDSLYDVKPKEIEMFISFTDNKLLVSDYPNHQNVMSILDNNFNLKTFENLALGFSIGSHDYEAKYIIKEFYTVSCCPNW